MCSPCRPLGTLLLYCFLWVFFHSSHWVSSISSGYRAKLTMGSSRNLNTHILVKGIIKGDFHWQKLTGGFRCANRGRQVIRKVAFNLLGTLKINFLPENCTHIHTHTNPNGFINPKEHHVHTRTDRHTHTYSHSVSCSKTQLTLRGDGNPSLLSYGHLVDTFVRLLKQCAK